MVAHRLFGIPEILAEIMQYTACQVSASTIPGRRQLLWIALSCKALAPHALDILWEKLDSLLPLLKLLPGFQNVDGIWSLSGAEAILEENWRQFGQYSRRIRSLALCNDPIDTSVYVWLSVRQIRTTPTLTSLRALEWEADIFPPAATMLFLSSQSLRKVTITFVDTNPGDKVSMHALVESAPNIQEIILDGPVIPASICLLAPCTSLNAIGISDMESVDQAALDVLSSLPRLFALQVTLPDFPLVTCSRSAGFLALEKLRITSTICSVTNFISNIRSPRLANITILNSHDEVGMNLHEFQVATTQWRRCMETLASNAYYRHSLRYIEGKTFRHTQEHSRDVCAMLVLEPLLELQQIEELRFGGAFSSMFLNDQDVHVIASAWPNICHLQLPAIFPHGICPTFASLQSLSLLCPRLTHLEMSVDLCTMPSPADLCWSSHGLTRLSLVYSSFGNVFNTARLLDFLFPKLSVYIQVGINLRRATTNEQEITNLLHLCQEVRETERKRYGILP